MSDTVEFFNFFGEASRCFQETGNPVLMAGDIIVLDNCATHHNAGGFALGESLDDMGIDVVYLPTYSPEMNRVELVFQKLKIILKRELIYCAIDEILPNDMHGFFRHTDYIFV
jgi:transposase